MRILWITNILFPEAESLIKGQPFTLSGSGGWLLSSAMSLCKTDGVSLAVASVYPGTTELKCFEAASGITYYIIPYGNGNIRENPEYDKYWETVIRQFKPGLIHLHGTEYSHGLSCINAVDNSVPVIASLQGIVSAIAQNYLGGMSNRQIFMNLTIYDLIHQSIWQEQKEMYERAVIEKRILSKIKYVIGRTSFDKKAALAINPTLTYYHCNETLRDPFYHTPHWEYNKCRAYSIFFSQARYPLKGLHILLQALQIVKKQYPDACLRIAGDDMTKSGSLNAILHKGGYARFITRMIKRLGLRKSVVFVGNLDENQMKKEYLDANVFVCASSNENSSNSICEAQMVGVPIIASNVGGNADLINNSEMGSLYPFGDYRKLASIICGAFNSSIVFNNLTMIKNANDRHNLYTNNRQLLFIYKDVMSKCS